MSSLTVLDGFSSMMWVVEELQPGGTEGWGKQAKKHGKWNKLIIERSLHLEFKFASQSKKDHHNRGEFIGERFKGRALRGKQNLLNREVVGRNSGGRQFAIGGQPSGSERNEHPSKSFNTDDNGTRLMGWQCQPPELGREAAGNQWRLLINLCIYILSVIPTSGLYSDLTSVLSMASRARLLKRAWPILLWCRT